MDSKPKLERISNKTSLRVKMSRPSIMTIYQAVNWRGKMKSLPISLCLHFVREESDV